MKISMSKVNKLGLTKIEQLIALIRGLGKEADKKGITEKKLDKMMDETKAQVYKKTYGG